jgi:uncharacterized protein YkwD
MEIRLMPLAALGGLPQALPAQAGAPPQQQMVAAIILIPMDQLQGLPNGQMATIELPPFMQEPLPGQPAVQPAMAQAPAQPGNAMPAGFAQAPGVQFGPQPAMMNPFGGFGPMGPMAAPEPLDPKDAAQQVLKLVNAERAKAGLAALAADAKLDTAAQKHSEDMAKRNYMAHVTPDGVDPWARMAAEGAQGIGENIAKGQQTPAEAVQAWMDDPPHRAAIMNPMARTMGLGVADGGMRYWTQDFGL